MNTPSDTKPEKMSPSGDLEKPPLDSGHVAVIVTSDIDAKEQEGGVVSFAMNAHERNTADNPYREGTFTSPVLLRRVDSERLLPRPFSSFRQLVVATYLSFLCCCCCFSAYANRLALRAQSQREKGLYSNASHTASRASCWFFASVITGLLLVAFFTTLTLVLTLKSRGVN